MWLGVFKDAVFPHERPVWSDEAGKHKITKESILLPPEGAWQWQTNWIVEIDPQFNDKHGWAFANDFRGPYKKSRGFVDLVRRRKWVRVACAAQPPQSRLIESGLQSGSSSNLDMGIAAREVLDDHVRGAMGSRGGENKKTK